MMKIGKQFIHHLLQKQGISFKQNHKKWLLETMLLPVSDISFFFVNLILAVFYYAGFITLQILIITILFILISTNMSLARYLHLLFYTILILEISQSQPFDPYNPPLDRFPFLEYATLEHIGYYWSPNMTTNRFKKNDDAIVVKFHYKEDFQYIMYQIPKNNQNVLSFTVHQPFDRPFDEKFPKKLQYDWMKKTVTRLYNPIINESIPNINISGYILQNVFNNASSNLVRNNTNFTGQIQEVPLYKITGQYRKLTRPQYSFLRSFEMAVNQVMRKVNGKNFRLLTRAFKHNITKWTKTVYTNYSFLFEGKNSYVFSYALIRQAPSPARYSDGFGVHHLPFPKQNQPPQQIIQYPKNARPINNLQICLSRIIQFGLWMMPEIAWKNPGTNFLHNKFTNASAYDLPNNTGIQFYLHYRPSYKDIERQSLNATINGTCRYSVEAGNKYLQMPVNLTGSFTNYTLVPK